MGSYEYFEFFYPLLARTIFSDHSARFRCKESCPSCYNFAINAEEGGDSKVVSNINPREEGINTFGYFLLREKLVIQYYVFRSSYEPSRRDCACSHERTTKMSNHTDIGVGNFDS